MIVSIEIPDEFRDRILATRRADWASWLGDLPEIIGTYCESWELSLGETFPLSWNYVSAADRMSGEQCVLKAEPIVQPDAEGATREARALELAGTSAVRLVEKDPPAGVLLLERADPGITLADLATLDDDQATEHLALTMSRFWVEVPQEHGLPGVEELASAFERFDRGPHGAPARRKKASVPGSALGFQLGLDETGTGLPALREARVTAERVMAELTADREPRVVLHGDFHHENVLLDSGRGYVVIDPKGFVGEAASDLGAALYNPLDMVASIDDLGALFSRRIAIFEGVLGLDADRIKAWCYVKAVLSALWTVEDGGKLGGNDGLAVRSIRALRELI